jgi:hypothetical protein
MLRRSGMRIVNCFAQMRLSRNVFQRVRLHLGSDFVLSF